MKFRFNQTVKILKGRKIDGRYNVGKIVGIERYTNQLVLGYFNLKQFYDDFKKVKYKVAYQDCVTNRFCQEWFCEDEIENK